MDTHECSAEGHLHDALSGAPNAVQLAITRSLRRLRPDHFISATDAADFDPLHVARAHGGTLSSRPDVTEALVWRRDESGAGLTREALQGWWTFSWKGLTVELVAARWASPAECADTWWWIIARSEAEARQVFLDVCMACDEAHGQVLVYGEGRFTRSRALHEAIGGASWDELVLAPGLAEAIRGDARRFFARRDFYDEHRIPWRRGVLLVGPPGNGKTHTVRALLKELDRTTLFVRSFEGRHSRLAEGIERVFARARRTAPSVLVLEDLDCLVDDGTRSALLNELDGLAHNRGLFVIATTNHPEKLDASLLDRPSRFDRKFHFALPEPAERRTYLTTLWATQHSALHLTPGAVEALVERTRGFTYAYLKELMVNAALVWADEGGGRSIEAVALEVVARLKADLSTADESLGRRASDRAIGFS